MKHDEILSASLSFYPITIEIDLLDLYSFRACISSYKLDLKVVSTCTISILLSLIAVI